MSKDEDFDNRRGLVRNDHPDTSEFAADAVLPRSGTQRRKVYDFLAERGTAGATDLQMQRGLNLIGNTQRPRRRELVKDGLVKDSGRRVHMNGRPMIVWVVVDRVAAAVAAALNAPVTDTFHKMERRESA